MLHPWLPKTRCLLCSDCSFPLALNAIGVKPGMGCLFFLVALMKDGWGSVLCKGGLFITGVFIQTGVHTTDDRVQREQTALSERLCAHYQSRHWRVCAGEAQQQHSGQEDEVWLLTVSSLPHALWGSKLGSRVLADALLKECLKCF